MPNHIALALKPELLAEDIVVCPLTLGSHVDHVLTRQAAELLDRPLLFYADIPYLLNDSETLAPAITLMQEELFDVSEQGQKTWLAGVAAYKSQINSLYTEQGTLEDAIRVYWEDRHGVRLWHVVSLLPDA